MSPTTAGPGRSGSKTPPRPRPTTRAWLATPTPSISQAIDNVGNTEAFHATADTQTTVTLGSSAPVVTTSGNTGQTFTLGGSAVAVDSGVTVTSSDTDLTGATMTIANAQSGDTLNFTNQNGITRQLLRWRADLERQRHAGPIPGGLAVGHVLHDQHQHHHPDAVESSLTTTASPTPAIRQPRASTCRSPRRS